MKRFIDLGLPSGTRWADRNERGFLSHDKALRRLKRRSRKLPMVVDWYELVTKCTWVWDRVGESYLVIGPNGNSITLPAQGFICCAGPSHAGEGHYWAAERRLDACTAYNFFFDKRQRIPLDDSYRVLGMSVRTVKH